MQYAQYNKAQMSVEIQNNEMGEKLKSNQLKSRDQS